MVAWKGFGGPKALCENSAVVLKMKSAGEETALLEDAGDVADWASVATQNVGGFR